MKNKSLISINDFTRDEMLRIIELAADFEANPNQRLLEGKIIASLFFEPSTRTRLSFETAMNRLGARRIGFSDVNATSTTKGET
ncbi:MAG: aspartate carbamoyltransferase, partial [Bacteroidales bacterium]|nr:aspartate carbamoyltransferase [Bacteroidales bacterium]